MTAHGEEPDTVMPPAESGAVVPPAEPAPVTPVRRQRSTRAEARPSLQAPLLSGRSLAPPHKPSRLDVVRDNKAVVIVALLVVLAVVVALAFDGTNGGDDSSNAISALVVTRAGRPGPARSATATGR